MLQSPPCDGRRVSPRSFPQLWKKMWKSQVFALLLRPTPALERVFTRRRLESAVFAGSAGDRWGKRVVTQGALAGESPRMHARPAQART